MEITFNFRNAFKDSILSKSNKERCYNLSYIRTFFLAVTCCFCENSSCAQIIAWDFDEDLNGSKSPKITISHVSVSDLSQGNNNGTTTMINSSSPSSGYSGASGKNNAGAAAISAPFDKSTSTYFEFTLTPDFGYSVNISAINFGSRSTGTGPQSYTIRSSVDSYNSEIAANALPVDSKWYLYQNTFNTISSGFPITIRIYGFNGIGASQNTAVWRIDDFSLQATTSALKTYYRSRQNGNWSVSSTWESSTDNTTWNIATNPPTKDADKILIQSGHTIYVNSLVSLDQTTIAGTLELQTGGILNINDGPGDDITILANGILQVTSSDNYTNSVLQTGAANINITIKGKITIGNGTSSTGNGYENFATSLNNVWNDGAICEYNNNGIFQIAGLTYFPNSPSADVPIFRVIKVNGTAAAGLGNDFRLKGIFELTTDVTFSGAGSKYFRNGIKGTGTLTQLNAGKIYLNATNAVLDGASLKLVLSAVMDLAPTTIVPIGANITISGSNMNNSSGILTINGTLNMTTSTITNSSGLIIINKNYTTAHPGGFSGSSSSIPSATGNIVVNSGSTIELNSNGAQSLNARNDFFNLILSGKGIKKPNGPFSPLGTITIKDDAIFDCTGVTNGINIGNDNTNLTMAGNSRLIVSTYGPNPKMGGLYNLTGGVIEFRGLNGTAQNIRSKIYQNIEVTGNNVLMSDGNIWLNTNGTFTIKNGGVFSINDNTIRGIGDATQSVTVESGGLFKCGTNMGFNGAPITSVPIKSSAVHETIKNITLQLGSTVEYSRNGDQPITNADGLIYQNLVISGNGNKIAPPDNLIIQGNLSKTSSAVFSHNNGTVIFNGVNIQSYSSISPQIIFNNLTNQNVSGLNINDSLSVYKELLLANNSVINLNADITLLSNKDQTASIGQLGTNAKMNYGLGRFIIERYINTNTTNGGHLKSWQLISTPAFGETIFDTWQEKGSKTVSGYGTWITDKTGTDNGFDGTSLAPSMKYYDPVTNSWIGISKTNLDLVSAKGYLIFVRGDRGATSINSPATPTVLRTRGKIYTPDFLPPASIVSPGKFQSVGNPYASVIDFSKINSSNIGSYYIAWDPTFGGEYGVGGYQTITAATNFKAVPGNTTNYNSTSDYRNVQSGQAFFVFNYTALPGSVSFTEACKMSGNQHLINRELIIERPILFANLISGGIISDGNAVAFDQKFSNRVDGDDALKMNNSGENFAINTDGKILSVEAHEEAKENDIIFYHLNNLSKQEYQFSFIPENMNTKLEAYLIDQYLKNEIPVSLTDTTFVNFAVTNDEKSSMQDRFYLAFRATSGPAVFSFSSMNVHPQDENVKIGWKVENENGIKNYQVEYSSDGINFSNIGTVSSQNEISNSYEFIHYQPKPGNNFYRIRINKLNGEVEYKKTVKVWIPEPISFIEVYPNPVQNGVVEIQFRSQPFGKYGFNLYNSIGQKIFSKEMNYDGGNSIQLIKPDRNFIYGIYHLEILKPNGDKKVIKVWK